jgi:hypothetical protein
MTDEEFRSARSRWIVFFASPREVDWGSDLEAFRWADYSLSHNVNMGEGLRRGRGN